MTIVKVLLSLLTVLVLASSELVPMRRQRNRTKTTTTTEDPQKKQYVFEGVDYDLMPFKVNENRFDCLGHFIRCIRTKTYFAPVCGFDVWTWYYEDYYNFCQLDLVNCYHRLKFNHGIYGVNGFQEERIFYNGERFDCDFYYNIARNSSEMDKLYFRSANPKYNSKPRPGMYKGVDDGKKILNSFYKTHTSDLNRSNSLGMKKALDLHGSHDTNKRGSSTKNLQDALKWYGLNKTNISDIFKLIHSESDYY